MNKPASAPRTPTADVQNAIRALGQSSLYASYLAEMIVLLARVCEEIDEAKRLLPAPPAPGKMIISAEPVFHERVQRALAAAGSFTHFVKGPDLSARKAKAADFMAAARAEALARELLTVDLSELHAVAVRHRLEHIDEYLDELALRLPNSGQGTPTWLAHNIIVSSANDLNFLRADVPASIALRLYALDDDRYHHLGASIHLGTLRSQAAAARDVLKVAIRRCMTGNHALDHGTHQTTLALLKFVADPAK